MKFSINLSGKTLYTVMRECRYTPAFVSAKPAIGSATKQELAFQRLLSGRPYPKFHAYCTVSQDRKTASINLHLDQKQPSYSGTSAHSGEYDGPLIEDEITRIQTKCAS